MLNITDKASVVLAERPPTPVTVFCPNLYPDTSLFHFWGYMNNLKNSKFYFTIYSLKTQHKKVQPYTLFIILRIRIRTRNTDSHPQSCWLQIQFRCGSTTLVENQIFWTKRYFGSMRHYKKFQAERYRYRTSFWFRRRKNTIESE